MRGVIGGFSPLGALAVQATRVIEDPRIERSRLTASQLAEDIPGSYAIWQSLATSNEDASAVVSKPHASEAVQHPVSVVPVPLYELARVLSGDEHGGAPPDDVADAPPDAAPPPPVRATLNRARILPTCCTRFGG